MRQRLLREESESRQSLDINPEKESLGKRGSKRMQHIAMIWMHVSPRYAASLLRLSNSQYLRVQMCVNAVCLLAVLVSARYTAACLISGDICPV